MTNPQEQLEAVVARAREYMTAALGRPVAEAWVQLGVAIDELDGNPHGTLMHGRGIQKGQDLWIRWAVAAMTRLKQAIDQEAESTTARILLFDDGSCAVETFQSRGAVDTDTLCGWRRRRTRYGEGEDPDRAIARWEQAAWREATEVCGTTDCQDRAALLGRAVRLLRQIAGTEWLKSGAKKIRLDIWQLFEDASHYLTSSPREHRCEDQMPDEILFAKTTGLTWTCPACGRWLVLEAGGAWRSYAETP